MPTDRLDRCVARMKRNMVIGALLLGALIGTITANTYRDLREPHCPTEDSCIVDYHHGHWTVREVTP